MAEVTFEGSGCSISQASASMMTEAVTGRSRRGGDAARRGVPGDDGGRGRAGRGDVRRPRGAEGRREVPGAHQVRGTGLGCLPGGRLGPRPAPRDVPPRGRGRPAGRPAPSSRGAHPRLRERHRAASVAGSPAGWGCSRPSPTWSSTGTAAATSRSSGWTIPSTSRRRTAPSMRSCCSSRCTTTRSKRRERSSPRRRDSRAGASSSWRTPQ